jgi:hypothetical protein
MGARPINIVALLVFFRSPSRRVRFAMLAMSRRDGGRAAGVPDPKRAKTLAMGGMAARRRFQRETAAVHLETRFESKQRDSI